MWSILLPAISLGLLSSFHCVGMCGPLALSLPIQQLTHTRQFLAVGAYHAGRITTYASAGALFGLLGRGVWLAGFQQGFSISLGVLILCILIAGRLNRNSTGQPVLLKKSFAGLQGVIYRLWRSPSRAKFVGMGMANGLLPCGMVYLALAGASSTTRITDAIVFMIFFGLGTLPLLIALSYYGRRISLSFRITMKKAIPLFIASMAVLLILRGLGLGIPFVSPILPAQPGAALHCH